MNSVLFVFWVVSLVLYGVSGAVWVALQVRFNVAKRRFGCWLRLLGLVSVSDVINSCLEELIIMTSRCRWLNCA